MIDLSVAIPSWNTREFLDQCLRSVYETAKGFSFEVIVVDNASSDGSPEMVASKYPHVKLVRNRTNLGFAAACNIGFKHSTGRYFLILNSDTIVLPNAFAYLIQFMDEHPEAGAAGCRLLNRDGTLQRSCSKFPSVLTELFDALYLSKLFPNSRIFGGYSMYYWDFDQIREVDFAGGSCLIVRRETIEEVGLLDEGFFMYTEEADWCYRMWQHGWKVYYYPYAQVIHLGGESSRQFGKDILLHLYASRNRFIRKHHGVVAAVLHRTVVMVGALCRLLVFSIQRFKHREMVDKLAFQLKVLEWSLRGFAHGSVSNRAVGSSA